MAPSTSSNTPGQLLINASVGFVPSGMGFSSLEGLITQLCSRTQLAGKVQSWEGLLPLVGAPATLPARRQDPGLTPTSSQDVRDLCPNPTSDRFPL